MRRVASLHWRLFFVLLLLLPIQFGRHFWPSWSYVLGLKIDYLSPTIYLTDILVVVILGLWGIEKIVKLSNCQISKFLKNYWQIFVIFVFLLVNALLAQNSGTAVYKFVKIVELFLLGLYVAKNRYSLPRSGKLCLLAISYSLAMAVFYSSLIVLAQFIKQASLGSVFWWLGERTFNAATPGIAKAVIDGRLLMRPYATFSHPNALAGFLLVGLILTFPFVFKKKKLFATAKRQALLIGYLLFAVSALALTFSRSAWLVGLTVIGFYLLKRRKFLWAGVHFSVSFAFIFLFARQFSLDEAFFQRLQLSKVAGLMIQSNPLVGVGLNNFITRLPDFWQNLGWTYWLQPVHNFYLLVAAETGLVGLLVFLWFLFLTYKKLLVTNNLPRRPAGYLLFTALSSILLLGLFDHYWLTLQQTQLLFAVVFGLSWSVRNDKLDGNV